MDNNYSVSKSPTWGVIVLLIIFFWPVGLYLLYKRLTSGTTVEFVRENTGKLVQKTSGGFLIASKLITVVAWALAFITFCGLMTLPDDHSFSNLMFFVFFLGATIGMFILRSLLKKKEKLTKTYFGLINIEGMRNIVEIAAHVKRSEDKVIADLEDLASKGAFGDAYVNAIKKRIVMKLDVMPQGEMLVAKCKNCGATKSVVRSKICKCDYCESPIMAD